MRCNPRLLLLAGKSQSLQDRQSQQHETHRNCHNYQSATVWGVLQVHQPKRWLQLLVWPRENAGPGVDDPELFGIEEISEPMGTEPEGLRLARGFQSAPVIADG